MDRLEAATHAIREARRHDHDGNRQLCIEALKDAEYWIDELLTEALIADELEPVDIGDDVPGGGAI